MIDAIYQGNDEKIIKVSDYLEDKFASLLRVEADLVYYGHFSWESVQKMKPVERMFHINEINRRVKEKNEALSRMK